jgi:ferredoxin-NADP reductase
LIRTMVPDYRQCLFYVSGPKGMVDSFKETLAKMDVPASQVKIDFFQGLS